MKHNILLCFRILLQKNVGENPETKWMSFWRRSLIKCILMFTYMHCICACVRRQCTQAMWNRTWLCWIQPLAVGLKLILLFFSLFRTNLDRFGWRDTSTNYILLCVKKKGKWILHSLGNGGAGTQWTRLNFSGSIHHTPSLLMSRFQDFSWILTLPQIVYIFQRFLPSAARPGTTPLSPSPCA